MNVLYAGFRGERNSSFRLVSRLPGERCFLTNSFPGLERDIARIRDEYGAVYLFGLDKTLRESVRIEPCAAGEDGVLYTTADLSALARRLDRWNIPCSTAARPTRYLCNRAYYRLLEQMSCPVVLLHIPSQKNLSQELLARLIAAFSCETEF